MRVSLKFSMIVIILAAAAAVPLQAANQVAAKPQVSAPKNRCPTRPTSLSRISRAKMSPSPASKAKS